MIKAWCTAGLGILCAGVVDFLGKSLELEIGAS